MSATMDEPRMSTDDSSLRLIKPIRLRLRLPELRMNTLRDIAAARGISAETLILEQIDKNLTQRPDHLDGKHYNGSAIMDDKMPAEIRLKLVRRKHFVYEGDGKGLIEHPHRHVDLYIGIPEPQMIKLREAAATRGTTVTGLIQQFIDEMTA